MRQGQICLAFAGLVLSFSVSVEAGSEKSMTGSFELPSFASPEAPVDSTGEKDSSAALALAVDAANAHSAFIRGGRAPRVVCIHIPAGTYRISKAPGAFKGAGCVFGDGSAATILRLDPTFVGDLFAWSEAWTVYGTSGPTVRHLRIEGSPEATQPQNALMFYDRNDNVTLEDVYIDNLPGRAIGTGLLKPDNSAGQAYIRESHLRSIRVFRSGTVDLPAVEFATQGNGNVDGTNEVSASQVDIFGARGPALVIRNSSQRGVVRDLKFDSLRIEGPGPEGTAEGDLLQIGDPGMTGGIGHLSFTSLELIDPPPGYAAVRIDSAAPPGQGPTKIFMQGYIGGGFSKGKGLKIDNASLIHAQFNQIRTEDTNVVVGSGVRDVVLDGGGAEEGWTYAINPSSRKEVSAPVRRVIPSQNP